ncbi:Synaptonemal complex central element protein 2 Central element synaptonemal complex protein 1 [Channa argus]|uniref:Synaptonemal complex central element protein 2 Central element synaptonemal complex protein 1 n=1 Tax=Channa argus TaxID=215402 RepID=A0A6G1PAH3_CHAAH|nr:Synaptonemal complex central element protein 2 Central element synaptonemal complex protein 1 [Channa argus]KAK2919374.1 hypothetical protein Q8A73_003745 [Channa argus]
MDFFLEDPASSSICESTGKKGHEDSEMIEKTDNYCMTEVREQPRSSDIDVTSRRVQELIEKINSSRANNQTVMDSLQEKLVAKVMEKCLQMKEHMYTVYEENGNEMQVKLQELSEVLDSCTKLNNELQEANRALANLRERLAITPTSESQ